MGAGSSKPMLDALRLHMLCTFYVAANFIGPVLPLVAAGAYKGSKVCRAFCLLTLVDYLIPLKLPALWPACCDCCDAVAGKQAYFDAEVVCEADFKQDKNHLVCYHPHSLYGIGYDVMAWHITRTFGSACLFTGADVVRFLPLLRRVLAWWGYTSVSLKAMRENLLRSYPYNVLTLLPGGIAEMFYGIGCEQVVLRKRKGFCKLALQTGASLVPCYTMGANDVYTRYFGPKSLAAKLSSKLQVSLLFWTGRWGIPFGCVPKRTKLKVLIGPAIEVEKTEQPSIAQVEALHARYVQELKALFDRHKASMGPEWAGRKLYLEDEEPEPMRPNAEKLGAAS